MKISINQLQKCEINSKIYNDGSVGDLINSIKEVGLLQPLVITPDNIIISGHRRYKAIQSLGWEQVECEIKTIPDDEMDIYIVSYNTHRVKKATEILAEVRVLYNKLWVGRGKNKGIGGRNPNIRDVVSNKIGASSSMIQQLMYIDDNKPELLKLIDDEKITINGAYYEVKKHLNLQSLKECDFQSRADPLTIEDLTLHEKSSEDMFEIQDKTIQTIITSPPYYKKRNYSQDNQIGLEDTQEGYLVRILSVMKECRRVIKDDGSMFLVIGDSYDDRGCLRQIPERVALEMVSQGWILRNKLIRHYTNAKPENGNIKRWGTSYEIVFFFTTSMDYYFDMDSVRVPYTSGTKDFASSLTGGTPKHHSLNEDAHIQSQQSYIRNPIGAVPKDVLQMMLNQKTDKYIPDHNEKEASIEHSAQFPEKLIRPFLLGTSREGDTILDPFMGAGTTAKVALDNGRKVIGYEINPHFIDTIYSRCASCVRTSTTGIKNITEETQN